MSHIILIDTDILIDVSRRISTAINRIEEEENKAKLSISVITNMELIVGCRNKFSSLGNSEGRMKKWGIGNCVRVWHCQTPTISVS